MTVAKPIVARPPKRRRSEPEDAERSFISHSDRSRPIVAISLRAIHIVVFIGLAIAGLGPLLFLLKAALSPTQDIIRAPFAFFPSGEILWSNLWEAWTQLDVGRYLLNTAVMAGGAAVTNLVVCTLGAYVLSVLRPRWGGILSGAVLATLFVPGVVSLVPLYLTVTDMPLIGVNLKDTYWAIWLPAAANAFNVLIIKRFFDDLPTDLFEAARIDGAGVLRILWSIVLPLSRPILGVVALLSVLAAWKDYLWPLLVLSDPSVSPISVALPKLSRFAELNTQMAALFLAVLLPVIIFVIFQRQFLSGVSASGGVKG